jgi:hypothetical protein
MPPIFNSIQYFYWKEHNRGVIQTINIQLQYIINILEINKHKDWIIDNNLQQGGCVYLKLVVCTYKLDFRSFGETGLIVFIISSSKISVGAKTFS